MTAQEQPQVRTWTEAPASVTVRVLDAEGFDVMVTLRDDSGADLLPKVDAALKWLKSQGYRPTNGHSAKGAGQVAQAAQDAAASDPDVLTDDRGKRYKVCEQHQARMYEKTGKGGQHWYSHQLADGSWCKGKGG